MSIIEKQHQAEQTEGPPLIVFTKLERFMVCVFVAAFVLGIYCIIRVYGAL